MNLFLIAISVTFSGLLVNSYLQPTNTIKAEYSTKMCTRDLNQWGHASRCKCNNDMKYDNRSGYCFDHLVKLKKLTLDGTLNLGVFAIGGETTGSEIQTTSGKTYELILTNSDKSKLLKYDTSILKVTGDYINLPTTEKSLRRAIIVESYDLIEN